MGMDFGSVPILFINNNNKKNPVYRTLRLRWGVLGDIYPSAAV